MRHSALFASVVAASLILAADAAAAPRVELHPARSTPGRQITVTGTGFCAQPACSAVTLEITGVPVATDVPVSPQGAFQKRVKVPGMTRPEPVGVVATQELADATRRTAIALLEIILPINAPKRPAGNPPAPASPAAAPRAKRDPAPHAERPAPARSASADTDVPDPAPVPTRDAEAPPQQTANSDHDLWTWSPALAAVALLAAVAAAHVARRSTRAR